MTIRSIVGVPVETAPVQVKSSQFVSEFKESIEEVCTTTKEGKDKIGVLLEKKSLTKADKAKINSLLSDISQKIESDLPFVEECFQEEIERTVQSVKLDIDAYTMYKLGSDQLKYVE